MKQIELVRKINKFGENTWIDQVSIFISSTYFLVSLYLLINILIYFFYPDIRLWLIASMFLSLIIHYLIHELLIKKLLRPVFYVERPYLTDAMIRPLGSKFSDSAFPSGHMSITAAPLTILVYIYQPLWVLAVLFLLLTAFSRLHNGYHYLIDVVFGLIFGIGYGFLAIFLIDKLMLLI